MDQQRKLAVEIADKIGSAKDLRDLRAILRHDLAKLVSQDSDRYVDGSESSVGIKGEKRVGIWVSRITEGGESFVRCDEPDPWLLWSSMKVIPAKSSRLRVVLLGESVARGCLYDPHFNCAKSLQDTLNCATTSEDLEVIDLARKGLTYEQLFELAEGSLALQPDALVIFAGNNWRTPQGVPIATLNRELRRVKGWHAVKEYIELLVYEAVRSLVIKLSQISTHHSIPILFVIPEFNLGDWRSYNGWRSPLLIGPASQEWHTQRSIADNALAAGNFEEAALAASSMLALDGGTSPIPYEILGLCCQQRGDNIHARKLMQEAGNAALSLPVPKAPRCFGVTQEALRTECAAHGLATVDLPRVFGEALSGKLPNRSLFLDYCHLSAQGIHLAMTATAERLLRLTNTPVRDPHALETRKVSVERHVLAQAHFAAAIMNAHGGQGYDIIRFHFAEAFRHAPEFVEVGRLFGDFTVRKAPALMCETFAQLMGKRDELPMISFLGIDLPGQRKQLNSVLIEALRDTVAGESTDLAQRIETLLRDQYSVQESPFELLDSPYCDQTLVCVEHQWWDRKAYFQAREPMSRFQVICEKSCAVILELTCRVHYDSPVSQSFAVMVNGELIACLPATTTWAQHRITVPSLSLRNGANSLIVAWPEPEIDADQRCQELVATLDSSGSTSDWFRCPEMYPIYGEIQQLSAMSRVS